MKKQFLTGTALLVAAICSFNIQGAAAKATKRAAPGAKSKIARQAYLAAGGKMEALSSLLRREFEGVSIQDLIDHNLLPTPVIAEGKLVLHLSSKNINDLKGIKNIPNIDTIMLINLDRNLITHIAPGTFAGLNHLIGLSLMYNKISSLTPNAFLGLDSLESLNLSKNNISDIAQGVFSGLKELATLQLEGNQLSTIAPKTFFGLKGLKDLYLHENKLTDIVPGTFIGLNNPKINLSANNIPKNKRDLIQVGAGNATIVW